jgi:ribosomal protein S18 acetylase RimI-like enzyme
VKALRETFEVVITIRKFEPRDWPAVWQIIEPVFRSGETCTYSPDISEADARKSWIDAHPAIYVAESDGVILGTYYLKPNQPGLGSHVCNAGYIVSEKARGRGIATLMCEHSQSEAIRMGFRAMQFNIVVATNETAVRLWQKMGFQIVGRLPSAFKHSKLGFVDAFVMYKQL